MNDNAGVEKNAKMPEKGRFAYADALMKFDIADRLTLRDRPNNLLPPRIGKGVDERKQPPGPVRRKRRARKETTKGPLNADGDGQRPIRTGAIVDERAGTHDADESAGVQCAKVDAGRRDGQTRLVREFHDATRPLRPVDETEKVQPVGVVEGAGRAPESRFERFAHAEYDSTTAAALPPHFYKCGGSPARECGKTSDPPAPRGVALTKPCGTRTGAQNQFISNYPYHPDRITSPSKHRSGMHYYISGTLSLVRRVERDAPAGYVRPLIEPYVQFSRIRLTVWNI